MLPEDDDMGIPSDEDDDLEEEVKTETGFGCVVGECRNTVIEGSKRCVRIAPLEASPQQALLVRHFAFQAVCVSLSGCSWRQLCCCSIGQPSKGGA